MAVNGLNRIVIPTEAKRSGGTCCFSSASHASSPIKLTPRCSGPRSLNCRNTTDSLFCPCCVGILFDPASRRRVGNPIFISYRRDDTEGEAGRLFDDLTREFGSQNVFMDVAGVRPGVDFVQAIETNVADCGVLLAIIGPTWATITDAHGLRRLDDPSDFVVLEIASALKREVPLIPVLVHGATMPAPDQLPESLKSFSHRNSVELSHTRWRSDVQLLIEALRSYVVPTNESGSDPVHANVPVQLPAPHQPAVPAAVSPQPNRPSSVRWIAALAAVVVVVAAVILFRAHQSPPP